MWLTCCYENSIAAGAAVGGRGETRKLEKQKRNKNHEIQAEQMQSEKDGRGQSLS